MRREPIGGLPVSGAGCWWQPISCQAQLARLRSF